MTEASSVPPSPPRPPQPLRPLGHFAPAELVAAYEDWSRRTHDVQGELAVAYSGGADSTALLLAEARLRWTMATGAGELSLRRPLLALHVHHGLQAAADDFERHAINFTNDLHRHWPTRLVSRRVQVGLPLGASVEAQAREARYDALASMAKEHGIGTVALAQHADDQVETILLALSRGAGPAGVAGMAPSFDHDGVRFVRPWLDVPGQWLRQWLIDHDVTFAEDPSNADERYTRNRIRRRVLPALELALPAHRTTFARSARLMAHAQSLMAEVAAEDLVRVGEPPAIQRLHALSPLRQANVLRLWLRQRWQTTASEAQMNELVAVIQDCQTRGHQIHLRVGRGHVVRREQQIDFVPFL